MTNNILYATQIIVESLPISSSTHVAIIDQLLAHWNYATTPFPDYIDFLLHGPTLIVLALFFRKAWLSPLISLVKPSNMHRKRLAVIIGKIVLFTTLATLPPVIMMLGIIKPWLKETAFFAAHSTTMIGIGITMLSLYSLRWTSDTNKPLTTAKALSLGCVQALALFPGISRFASTYIAARWLGLSPRRAFETCFLIQVPLIIAAFFYFGLRGALHDGLTVALPTMITIIGATAIAYIALWNMWRLALHERLWILALYMPVPLMIVWWLK